MIVGAEADDDRKSEFGGHGLIPVRAEIKPGYQALGINDLQELELGSDSQELSTS
jgi:hypothetical protein